MKKRELTQCIIFKLKSTDKYRCLPPKNYTLNYPAIKHSPTHESKFHYQVIPHIFGYCSATDRWTELKISPLHRS